MASHKFEIISSTLSFLLLFATHISKAQVMYNSRPDILIPSFDVLLNNVCLVAPGYWFLTTTIGVNPKTALQSSLFSLSTPMIFDNLGNLVWCGYEEVGTSFGTNFHTCSLHGDADHLCFFSGMIGSEYWRGQGNILDSSYRTVENVLSGNGRVPADGHEFNVLPDGRSALITIYQPVQYDLSEYNISQGWVMDGIAQEINIESGEVLFEWRALEHVDPSLSPVPPSEAGAGISAVQAWQYFHINAVDKDPAGNYLISSRFYSTIYYVSATDGSIIWALNGINSSLSNFSLQGFNFSFQHDVRFLDYSNTGDVNSTVISILDNNSDGFTSNAVQSRGMIIELLTSNTRSVQNSTIVGTAKLLAAYEAPLPQGLLVESQGNVQVLAQGNVVVGWGNNAYVSEHLADGTAVYFANFTGGSSYRAYKANFTGTPLSTPAIYSYADNCFIAATHYVSWNGCTQCAAWHFYEGPDQAGPFILASKQQILKTGFETSFTGTKFAAYAYAEALDVFGTVLGNSQVERTFVPGGIQAVGCNGIL